jgi:hypothetical protein
VGLIMASRVYDEWVHRQDIRRALGLADEEIDLGSPSEFLLTAIVSSVLPKLKDAAGDVTLSLKDAPVPDWRYVPATGSGAPQDGPSEAAARITGPAPSFVMAAAGRDFYDQLRVDGVLKVEGDQDLAQRFLANLRVV